MTLLTTGVATFLAFGINFLMTPFIVDRLGIEAYGFVTLANTFVSYATILTTALNSFATRYVALEYHKGSICQASVYFSSIFFANIILSAMIFLAMFFFILNIDGILDVPEKLVFDVQCLFALVFANLCITNASVSFSSAAYIKNRLDITGVFQTLSYVMEALVLVILYSYFASKAAYFGFGLLVAGLVVFLGNIWLYRRFLPEVELRISLFSLSSVFEILKNGVWNSVNNLGNVLNNGIGMLLSNVLFGSIAMGQLSVSRTFSAVFSRLYQLVAQAFQPMLLWDYSEGKKKALVSKLLFASKLSGLAACLFFSGFVSLGICFYSLWIPGQDINFIYSLTIISMVSAFFEGQVNPLYYIYTLTLKNKIPTVITVIGGMINVLSIFLISRFTDFGVTGIAISTTAITSIIAIITNPLYMAHVLGISCQTLYRSFSRVWISGLMMCAVFFAISFAVKPLNWLSFVGCAVACCIAGSIVFCLVAFNCEERALLLGLAKKMLSPFSFGGNEKR